MNALDLLILSLATWRLAYLVTNEVGPWRAFERLRGALPLGGLTECVKCFSIWAAILMFVLWLTPLQPVVWILALSAGALMLASWTGVHHL